MTIFAVVCAGIFPLFHVGRVWFAWWLFPIPNSNVIWPQFRSPLEWDVFAVSTYGTVSVLFWYMGMIPDLGVLRDRAVQRLNKGVYEGGSAIAKKLAEGMDHFRKNFTRFLQWAGVMRVTTGAIMKWPTWFWQVFLRRSFFQFTRSSPSTSPLRCYRAGTLPFSPILCGRCDFLRFRHGADSMLPLRALYGLHDLITQRHIDNMCKICLGTGSIVGYAYIMEFFIAWHGANPYESFAFINRAFGQYWWAYVMMFSCNVFTPQLSGLRRCAENAALVWIMSIFINVGMWFDVL